MAGLSNYVNRVTEPQPAAVKSRRQQIADQVRMPAPVTKLNRGNPAFPTPPGDEGSFGKGVKHSNTPLDVKQEQSQSQQKHHSVFDTDVEDFDSTTTLALDEHLKSSQPRTQPYGYPHHGSEEYKGNDGTGNNYRGAADDDIQPQTITDGAEQQYLEQGVPFVDEEEEGEEERGEGEEDEDEEGGESGEDSGSEGGSQDGNHTVNLTDMSVRERALSANDDDLASLVRKVQRKGSRKTSLLLSPAPLGSRQSLPVRNGGSVVHAAAGSYRLDDLEDDYAESPSYLRENSAPQRAISSGTTGQKLRHPTQERHFQPLPNDKGPFQQRGSSNTTTGYKNQRSQPQVLQRDSFPLMPGSKPVSRKVGGPTTVPHTQLEQLEDHTMSSVFDTSDLGEDHYATSCSAELFANHATNSQEDSRMPAPKRPFQLDYDDVQLSEMSFEELKKEPFDHDPRALPNTLPKEVSSASLAEKLKYVTSSLKTDTEKDQKRQRFFSSLTIDEHEECGDMIVEEFSNVIKRFKDARRDKRKLAMAYEEEVANREERVRAKRELLEKDMHRLKRAGQDVISGKQA